MFKNIGLIIQVEYLIQWNFHIRSVFVWILVFKFLPWEDMILILSMMHC